MTKLNCRVGRTIAKKDWSDYVFLSGDRWNDKQILKIKETSVNKIVRSLNKVGIEFNNAKT